MAAVELHLATGDRQAIFRQPGATVLDLKRHFATELRLPLADIRVTADIDFARHRWVGRLLRDEEAVAEIRTGIHLFLARRFQLEFRIGNVNEAQSVIVEVEGFETFRSAADRALTRLGRSEVQYEILFAGRKLDLGQLIHSESGIQSMTTLHVFFPKVKLP